ncbi:interleukin-12 receptor subunit beta-1 [Poeciliopsis prolifica]|uniref:interleukin-12 receptor subunit beta-1 n=1 Tax=Poeciliopsis prolifica TaxID=188132 RepID=UPI0024136A7C|nr:interleukin-12 receptor subunit beta-1 [Poeciliopsis prolifica]
MIIFLLYLMETFQHLSSLTGYVIVLLLATISKGSACEGPSSPLCFRQNEDKDVYICEWDFNTTETEVTFDFYFNDNSENAPNEKIGDIKKNHIELGEERLIVTLRVNMWVEARAGKSICTSPVWSGILQHTVKYEPPQNISVTWLRNNLSLSWKSKYPSLAEVWFRIYATKSWEKRLMNTTNEAPEQKLLVVNLLKNTVYQVQIRQKSIQAKNSLWSDWSPVVIVPAEFEQPPIIRSRSTLLNGTRQVNLNWQMPQATAISGVTYIVNVTQSSLRCPCKKKNSHNTKRNNYTVYVSYSAANITVIAKNAAGLSPPAVVHVPAVSAPDLKTCDQTMLDKKLKNMCLEFYELQDADLIPERIWYLTSKNRSSKKEEMKNYMKDYTRYLYFEHKCHADKPQTGKMCLYYKKEGVPSKEPQNFMTVSDTHDSADLTWKQISYEHLHGFLTHYKLCTVKINSQSKPPECINISASTTKYHLKDLTSATKYNVTVAGVTQTGEGPIAMQSFTTLREKPFNVWISFGLLLGFFLFSIFCTVVLKRIKNKVFPPVPKPVMPDFRLRPPKSEEMWERKEEVHEVTLHKLVPEQKPVSEATVLKSECDVEAGRQVEKDGCCSGESDDESSSLASADDTLRKVDLKDLEQVETELAMLIYRNGLVFDVKSGSL